MDYEVILLGESWHLFFPETWMSAGLFHVILHGGLLFSLCGLQFLLESTAECREYVGLGEIMDFISLTFVGFLGHLVNNMGSSGFGVVKLMLDSILFVFKLLLTGLKMIHLGLEAL